MDAVKARALGWRARGQIRADLEQGLETALDTATKDLDRPVTFGITAQSQFIPITPSTLHSVIYDVLGSLEGFKWSSMLVIKGGTVTEPLDVDDWVRPVAVVSFKHTIPEAAGWVTGSAGDGTKANVGIKCIAVHDCNLLREFDFNTPVHRFSIILFTYKLAFKLHPYASIRAMVPMWRSIEQLMAYCIEKDMCLDGVNGNLELVEHSVKHKRYYNEAEGSHVISSSEEETGNPHKKSRVDVEDSQLPGSEPEFFEAPFAESSQAFEDSQALEESQFQYPEASQPYP